MTDTTPSNADTIRNAENVLGPRGSAIVTSENRGEVRRWLIAHGLPSAFVRTLTLSQLSGAYNDTTGDQMLRLVDASTAGTTDTLPGIESTQPIVVAAHQRAAAPSADPAVALSAAISTAIAGVIGNLPRDTIDAEQVRAIVRAEIAGAAKTVVEIRTADTVRAVEGLHHHLTGLVVSRLAAGVNVWLVGPAGTGKSTFGRIAAQALGAPYYSTGAIQSEHKLIGFIDATGRPQRTAFREAWEHGGVFALDDVDGSSAAALVAFNEATANGICNFPDGAVKRHPQCYLIATANTYGTGASAQYVGRMKQDDAVLDRFVPRFVDYDRALEKAIADSIDPRRAADWCARVWKCRDNANKHGIRAIFSTRAIVNGLRLLSAGETLDDVTADVLRRGLDDTAWQKVMHG